MDMLETLPKGEREEIRALVEKEEHSGLPNDVITRLACRNLGYCFLSNLSESQVAVNELHRNWKMWRDVKCVPLFQESMLVVIACTSPWNERLLRDIRRRTQMQVEAIGTTSVNIDRVMAEIGEPVLKSPRTDDENARSTVMTSWSSTSTSSSVAREIIRSAYEQGASDIHLEPWVDRVVVRFRIHGVLESMPPMPKSQGDEIIRAVKQMANLPISEVHKCSSSRISVDLDGRKTIDLRIEKQATQFGEAVVARLLDDRLIVEMGGALPFDDAKDTALVKSVLSKSSGMFITTGPTGSGKTTTNYLCIASMDRTERKIITAEDPVEYVMPGVQQVAINPEQGDRTFSNVLRSNLRCDPDVLIVGEIRDEITADIASRSVQTGHLVLATLHTNDTVGVIPRMLGLNISPSILAQVLSLVVSQRLCYRLCDNCKTPIEPSPAVLEHYDFYGLKAPEVIYERNGCKECQNTGTVGRLPIFELLHITKELRSYIRSPFDEVAFKAKRRELGGKSLAVDGLMKVAQGLTSYSEVAKEEEEFIPTV